MIGTGGKLTVRSSVRGSAGSVDPSRMIGLYDDRYSVTSLAQMAVFCLVSGDSRTNVINSSSISPLHWIMVVNEWMPGFLANTERNLVPGS